MTAPLFACTKCHSRHLFEELSHAEQFCKNCRSSHAVMKCAYCRNEFQPSKGLTSSICKKCTHSEQLYGKPGVCEYCNITAAFNGGYCHRCAYSKSKYGSPVPCEQCKLKCAFNKNTESKKKVDGKNLCWFCTLAYKRVLAKARRRHDKSGSKKTLSESNTSNDRGENSHTKKHPGNDKARHHHKRHRPHKNDDQTTPTKQPKVDSPLVSADKTTTTVVKPSGLRTSGLSATTSDQSFMEPGIADHMIVINQLRDQLEAMKKLVETKDKALMDKEKKITEIRAQQYDLEKDFRQKIAAQQSDWDMKYEDLQRQNRELQKQIKALSSKTKKLGTNSPMLQHTY